VELMIERVAALFRVNDDLLAAHEDVYGADPTTRCVALTAALASSPPWTRLRRGAFLVVRPDTGLVGLLGSVASEDHALVDALGWQVEDLVRRLRPVTYREAEAACLDLADRLRQRMTPDQVRSARVVGIPRGGLIVAGMLAYALQTRDTGVNWNADAATIIVDDCALSGLRLRESLVHHQGEPVLLALLHAHPDLCRRVEELEPSVQACLSARDLEDHARQRDDYAEWKRRWTDRSPKAYWIGDPDHVCYPWNEPDSMVWNPVTERAEGGWRVVPPSWCMKNRVASHVSDIQRCTWANADLTPEDGVLWATTADGVLVAGYGHSKAFSLRGSAATMWRALMHSDGIESAAQFTSSHHAINVDTARRDMERFINDLIERGLLHAHR
jgi:hypothetical protein